MCLVLGCCQLLLTFLSLSLSLSLFHYVEEFMHSAQMMSQITPLEVDILFHLCDLLHQTG